MTLVEPTPQIRGRRGEDSGAAHIQSQYRKGTDAIRQAQANYRVNCAYIDDPMQGHWVWWQSSSNQLVQLPRDPRRVRITIPRIGPESRRIMAKLLRRPLKFEVPPDAPDGATLRGARVAEAVLSHTAEDQKWNRLREELAWTVWKGGTGLICLDWDTSAGKELGIDPVTFRPIGTGDIRPTVLSIAQVATEPGTRDIERSFWWIKAESMPPAEAKKLYGLKDDPVADAHGSSLAIRPANGSAKPSSLTTVLTYYERPNPSRKNGMVAVVIGDKIVDGPKPWPFPFTDRLNLVCARETMIEGQWFGKTIVTDCVPIQTALNHSWTSQLEHMKQAANARLQAQENSRDLVSNLSDEAGEVIFYRDTEHKWLGPPQLSEWIFRVPERLQQSMDDALGVHDISRGQAPANIESGLGLSILQEQDDTPTGKLAQTLADVFGDLGTLVLKTYEAKVKEPEVRYASVPGPIGERVTWNGEAFMGQCYAKVPYDAVAPINEATRFARLQFFAQSGMITSPRAASAYLDLPGMNGDFIAAIDPHTAKARRENHEIMMGEICVPLPQDNHAIHIEEHIAEVMSARYERAEEEKQMLLQKHIQAHSTLAAEEAGEQALKMQYAPALAQAAQGTQPPGSLVPSNPAPSEDQLLGQPAVMGGQFGGNPETSGPAPELPQ